MLNAEKVALKKGELSPDYKKSPIRSFVYLLGAFVGYEVLNLSFYVDEEEMSELEDITDVGEVIELLPDTDDIKKANVNVKSEGAYEWLVDQTSNMMEAVLD